MDMNQNYLRIGTAMGSRASHDFLSVCFTLHCLKIIISSDFFVFPNHYRLGRTVMEIAAAGIIGLDLLPVAQRKFSLSKKSLNQADV